MYQFATSTWDDFFAGALGFQKWSPDSLYIYACGWTPDFEPILLNDHQTQQINRIQLER